MLRDGRGVTEDDDRAVAMFQRACAAGDAKGCELEAAP
jgi:TPR repeat protein